MENRLSRWGVGPKITLAALAYAAAAALVTLVWPDLFVLRSLGQFAGAGFVLIALGVLMWLLSAASVMQAYNRDQLVTTGIYSLVRHPLYSAWIVLIMPGLVILSRCWLLFLTPLVAYCAFKKLIRREDEYLQQRFGRPYAEYRARVPEILPLPRRHQPLGAKRAV
jgi:protein-S-isoprenylcysteine O-methyltransferase Ste14